MLLDQEAGEHQPVAERVDTPRDTSGGRIDEAEARGLKCGIARPADMLEAVLDIGAGLRLVERPEMIGRDHALAKLLHRRALHHGPKLGLADQKALQQRLIAELEVGEHPQLFDRSRREILSLVDDE